MGIELPVELTEVAAKAGVTWPKADEDAMRSSAAACLGSLARSIISCGSLSRSNSCEALPVP